MSESWLWNARWASARNSSALLDTSIRWHILEHLKQKWTNEQRQNRESVCDFEPDQVWITQDFAGPRSHERVQLDVCLLLSRSCSHGSSLARPGQVSHGAP